MCIVKWKVCIFANPVTFVHTTVAMYIHMLYYFSLVEKNDKNATNNKRNKENQCREEKPSNSIVDCWLDINKKLINESNKIVKMVKEDECENNYNVTSCVSNPLSKGSYI